MKVATIEAVQQIGNFSARFSQNQHVSVPNVDCYVYELHEHKNVSLRCVCFGSESLHGTKYNNEF